MPTSDDIPPIVTDEGAPHKYRTELPNTLVKGKRGKPLSIYAKWLYVYLKSWAGENGAWYRGTTALAEGSGMSRMAVSRAKQELVKYGLIAITPGANRHRQAEKIHILDIWLENMQEFQKVNQCTPQVHSHDEENQGEENSVYPPDTQCTHQIHSVPVVARIKNPLRRTPLEEERKPPLLPSGESPPSQRKAAKRCPQDYEPSPTVRQWAQRKYPGVDFDECLEALRDCEFRTAHTDWDATLKNWIRREAKTTPRRHVGQLKDQFPPGVISDKTQQTINAINFAREHRKTAHGDARRELRPVLGPASQNGRVL